MAGRLADVVQGADVRIVQRGDTLGLAREPFTELRIGGQRWRQNLDCHDAIEARVAGAIDLAHAAGPDGREDFVWPETGAPGQRHACVAYTPPANRSVAPWSGSMRVARTAGIADANAQSTIRPTQRRGHARRVRWADIVQEPGDEPCGGHPSDDAENQPDRRHQGHLRNHQTHHAERSRAERQTNPDLTCPLRHAIAKNTIKAHDDQHNRHRREKRGKQRERSIPHQGVIDERRLQSNIGYPKGWMNPRKLGPKQR